MRKKNDLLGDSEWEALRHRLSARPAASANQSRTYSHKQKKPALEPVRTPEEPKKVQVSLNLSLPKVKLPKFSKKQLKIAAVCAAILGVSVLAGIIVNNRGDKPIEANDVLSGSSQEPEFDTVLPSGKQENTTSSKLGYDPERKVASFTDTIGTANITVSQQPLPEQFKENTDEEVKKVAEGFSANEVINESNPKAYLGTDVSGAQTVIFHKNNLLIFILSNKQIEKDQWAEYITKLL